MSNENRIKELCYKIVEANMPTPPTMKSAPAQKSDTTSSGTTSTSLSGAPTTPAPYVPTEPDAQQKQQQQQQAQQSQSNPVTTQITQEEQKKKEQLPGTPAPTTPPATTQPAITTTTGIVSLLVKRAINEQKYQAINAKKYYISNKNEIIKNVWSGKKIAAKLNGKLGLKIADISNEENYMNLVKNGMVSIYEPVNNQTIGFSIILEHTKENFPLAVKMASLFKIKLAKKEIDCKIAKENNQLELVCKCKELQSTKDILEYVMSFYEENQIVKINFNDLEAGNLKKVYGSLNDNGKFRVYLDLEE